MSEQSRQICEGYQEGMEDSKNTMSMLIITYHLIKISTSNVKKSTSIHIPLDKQASGYMAVHKMNSTCKQGARTFTFAFTSS